MTSQMTGMTAQVLHQVQKSMRGVVQMLKTTVEAAAVTTAITTEFPTQTTTVPTLKQEPRLT